MRLLAALLCLACSSQKAKGVPDAAPGNVVLHAEGAVVKTGQVGDRVASTYVLVDVENTSDTDREVVVQGRLRSGTDLDLGALNDDHMRVPAHQKRTFALVSDKTVP